MTEQNRLLGLSLLSPSALNCRAGPESLLGGICFSPPPPALLPGDLPLLAVDMPRLDGGAALCEVWRSAQPMRSGRHGAIRYRENASVLFGCLSLTETGAGSRPPLQCSTEAAYRAIFGLLEARGFGALLRCWNYFPAINQTSHAIERYRQFNVGRQDAFLAYGRSVTGNVPAACALGTTGGPLHVAFLATRAEVIGIENPRQLAAYLYPDQYGPRSPTFSRAGMVRLGAQTLLFISGTASIVGHVSLHAGDVAAQTRESLLNIAAIVNKANQRAPEAGFRLDQLAYKVYLRHRDDLAAVRAAMVESLGSSLTAVFLQADICRADLLVEIEASGGHDFDETPDGRALAAAGDA